MKLYASKARFWIYLNGANAGYRSSLLIAKSLILCSKPISLTFQRLCFDA